MACSHDSRVRTEAVVKHQCEDLGCDRELWWSRLCAGVDHAVEADFVANASSLCVCVCVCVCVYARARVPKDR
jgi:hypothetical protein